MIEPKLGGDEELDRPGGKRRVDEVLLDLSEGGAVCGGEG